MALTPTLYRYRIDMSDVDRGFYGPIDIRAAMHPSESPAFLLTRVLAFALNAQEGLVFSPGGVSEADEPCIQALDATGARTLWIEVGSPSARKLHKASKATQTLLVYTYKNPVHLMDEIRANNVYHADQIGLFSFSPDFLGSLEAIMQRDNAWSLMHNEGSLIVTAGAGTTATTLQGEVTRHYLHTPV